MSENHKIQTQSKKFIQFPLSKKAYVLQLSITLSAVYPP